MRRVRQTANVVANPIGRAFTGKSCPHNRLVESTTTERGAAGSLRRDLHRPPPLPRGGGLGESLRLLSAQHRVRPLPLRSSQQHGASGSMEMKRNECSAAVAAGSSPASCNHAGPQRHLAGTAGGRTSGGLSAAGSGGGPPAARGSADGTPPRGGEKNAGDSAVGSGGGEASGVKKERGWAAAAATGGGSAARRAGNGGGAGATGGGSADGGSAGSGAGGVVGDLPFQVSELYAEMERNLMSRMHAQDKNRFRAVGLSSLLILIWVLSMFGTEIRRYFASQTAEVARETLKVEALQVQTQELATALVQALLNDQEVVRAGALFLREASANSETQAALVSLALYVLQHPDTRAETKLLAKKLVKAILDDPDTVLQVTDMALKVIRTPQFRQGASELVVALGQSQEVYGAVVDLASRVIQDPKVQATLSTVLSASSREVLQDQVVFDHSKVFVAQGGGAALTGAASDGGSTKRVGGTKITSSSFAVW
ncbi:unnamed protein product [Ectocarpus sp. 12 AP-2014]